MSKPQYREQPTVADAPSASAPVESAPPTDAELPIEILPDTIIADRYRIVRKLGAGAMGAVFLAEHVLMRKRFALKVLLPRAMASREIVARFEREAIAAGHIVHPGVCAATDFGRLPDGSFFLVLEYVDGRSLRSILADGALPPARALGIARQVLAALAAAHAAGVVHRDIKPENVMIVPSPSGADVVKVLDFGIAKVDEAALGRSDATKLTKLGAIYGTPTYMSPEQALGEAIDHRADLYAVGVMLHEMISGQPPFEGDGVVILALHINAAPPPLVSPHGPVPPALVAFVERLLAKRPADRPDSAAAALAEIEKFDAALPARPAPITTREAYETTASAALPRRTKTLAIVAIGGLLAAIIAAFGLRRALSSHEDDTSAGRRRSPSAIDSEKPQPAEKPPKQKAPPPANSATDGSKGFTGKVEATF